VRARERPARVRQSLADQNAGCDGNECEKDTGDELSALRRDGSSEWEHFLHSTGESIVPPGTGRAMFRWVPAVSGRLG